MKNGLLATTFAVLLMSGPSLGQVPVGFEMVEVEGDVGYGRGPGMNDCGTLVYVVRRPAEFEGIEVFRYDNGLIERVTFSEGIGADLPQINNAGTIVWSTAEFPYYRVFRLVNGQAEELAAGGGPAINDAGHIAWQLIYIPPNCEFEADIFFYDGERIQQITSESLSNQQPELNDFDDMAWGRKEVCDVYPWIGHIISYIGEQELELTDHPHQAAEARINNANRIAWGSEEGLDIWEDGIKYRVFDGPQFPEAMNNLGQIVIERWDAERLANNMWLLSGWPENPVLERITDDYDAINAQADINDWGEASWVRRNADRTLSIHMLRRIRTGDSEFDGDIDHDDLAKLVDCMTGPMWVERTDPGPEDSLCECRFLDINHDGSVDLRDYAIFQQNFGG